MKNKNYIFIWIILFVLTCLIGFGYYKTFNKQDSKNNSNKKISKVYLCEDYNGKFYSIETHRSTARCHRIGFECEDCEVFDYYIDNKIVYTENNNLHIYDLINKKSIKTLKYHQYAELFTQDNELYGILYFEEEEKKYFYNLTTDTKLDFFVGNESEGYEFNLICDECYLTTINNNKIINDMVIIQNFKVGIDGNRLLNLKTNEYVLDGVNSYNVFTEYTSDSKEEHGYYDVGNNGEKTIYDEKLSPIFKNESKDSQIQGKIDEIDYISKNIFFADFMNSDYAFAILDEKGNSYKNSILSVNELATKLYDKLKSNKANNITKNQIIIDLQTTNKKDVLSYQSEEKYYSSFSYIKDRNVGYMYFSYNDNYTESYASIEYEYDFNTNVLTEYVNECYYGDCGI